MIKKIIFAAAVVFFITGCEQKEQKQENIQNQKKVEKAVSSEPLKIEVVANKNAQEIKVKEKEVDKLQSKSYYYDYNIKSEYDQNAEPANVDASVRVKPRTAVEANMNIRSPYEKVKVSMLVKKLSKKFIVKCSACHNDYANGVIGPSLLGKDSDYIFDKIAQYKSGQEKNVLMTELIKMMNDKEIRELADEIYQFNEKIKQMRK